MLPRNPRHPVLPSCTLISDAFKVSATGLVVKVVDFLLSAHFVLQRAALGAGAETLAAIAGTFAQARDLKVWVCLAR